MNEVKNKPTTKLTRAERWGKAWPLLFCLVTAAAFMTICTKSSPLYPMNDWVDVNVYFTIGRKMAGGSVLYRDIFDHKGPLLYFIYALIGWASPRSYTGIYVMEILCFSLFLYFSGKCAGVYLKNKGLICGLLLLQAAAVAPSDAFLHGGSVEEMCLFPAACALYLTLRSVRKKEPIPGRDAFVIGLCASAAFWIKYTLCGNYFGLVLFVALYYLIGLRRPKDLLADIGWFLLGLAPVTVVVLLYFAVHGALGDLFQTYFYNNIFVYAGAEEKNLLTMAANAWDHSVTTWRLNRGYMALVLLGALAALPALRRRPWEALAVLLPLPALGFFALGNTFERYYGLYYAAFSILGLIVLGALAQRAAEKLPRDLPKAAGICLCGALGAGMLYYAYRTSPNNYLIGCEKKDMPQYQFAEIIDQEPGANLLNYGFLDGGFYFASGVEPEWKYFFLPNLRSPEVVAEQNRYMRQQLADFVVTQSEWNRELMDTVPGYKMVAQAEIRYEGRQIPYYLYQRE